MDKQTEVNCIHGYPQGIGCLECLRGSVNGK